MRHLVSAMLVVVAMIHLLPVAGVLGAERLSALYGLQITDPNLAILMRHRAILFGMLGGFFLVAAFTPSFQALALVAGFISVVAFLALAWTTGGYNSQIARVVTADIVALACLVVGSVAYFMVRREG